MQSCGCARITSTPSCPPQATTTSVNQFGRAVQGSLAGGMSSECSHCLREEGWVLAECIPVYVGIIVLLEVQGPSQESSLVSPNEKPFFKQLFVPRH